MTIGQYPVTVNTCTDTSVVSAAPDDEEIDGTSGCGGGVGGGCRGGGGLRLRLIAGYVARCGRNQIISYGILK